MARTLNGDVFFATTLYFPTEDVRQFGHVDYVYGVAGPRPGYVPLTVIPMAEDDHGNGYDEVLPANYRALVEDFGLYAENGLLVTVNLGMSEGLAYVGRDDSTTIGEVARELGLDYPVYSEEVWSAVSIERQWDYLRRDGLWDARQDCPELEEYDDEAVAEALWEGVMETGCGDWDGSGYYNWDEIVRLAAASLKGE